jgi:proline dehydrogenase
MQLLNRIITGVLPIVPKAVVQKVSARYIAGATLNDAVNTVRSLNKIGAMATVDVLGEFISTREEADQNARYCIEVVQRLFSEKLQGNLSIKLTSLGLGLDDELCEHNVRSILTTAQNCGNMFVRMDMENSPYTTLTLDLYKKLRREFPNVGAVLQSYMRRTEQDIKDLLMDGAANGVRTNIRLCKGIYREAPEIAFQERKEVQENYLRSLELLLSGGAYVGIATHDDVLIEGGKKLVKKYARANDTFEFQMLLGVRENARDKTIREGYRLRVYVPFGSEWYGYSMRRLKENPQVAGYIVKAMFGLS